MVLVSNSSCTQLITTLINAIIRSGKDQNNLDNGFIIGLFKGKGDVLDRGDYRGLKLLDHITKILERIAEQYIRELITLNDMQFGIVPGPGITDVIFIVLLCKKNRTPRVKLYISPSSILRKLLTEFPAKFYRER